MGGAVAIAIGILIVWALKGGQPTVSRVTFIPVTALTFIVVGIASFLRGVGLM